MKLAAYRNFEFKEKDYVDVNLIHLDLKIDMYFESKGCELHDGFFGRRVYKSPEGYKAVRKRKFRKSSVRDTFTSKFPYEERKKHMKRMVRIYSEFGFDLTGV